MPKRIAAIGEPMVELAPAGPADQFTLAFAGDTMNTAWYLKRLNPALEVDYITRLGRDDMSDRLADYLAKSGIGTDYISRCDTRTVGLYMISLANGERSFAYWRGQSAARELAHDLEALGAACDGADIVYVSGITLAVLEGPGRDNLFAALKAARAGGALVAFDPNLRPRLWPDTDTMCAAVMEAAALSDIALPSFEDEASFFGDADPQATLDRYAGAGARTVIVKNGEGAIVYLHQGAQGSFTPAPVAQVVDTTAAGDSFNAGILAHFAMDAPLAPLIETAAGVSAKVIQARGALVKI
ncbi:2-keto-3-deoxygluconate kinase [Litoreibacter ponti]|uniref:2-keto-3-deoxygluconate kinase n=1 Tax=Litoreibacter ponti TaxID=1510457 RepID=A0A2T6BJS7_9RHOB|nr:sugar kinase [Litoreibacter ponti]PTX56319.1 2-keto-3-deoxygluconate kinase [Litoreibacter ponti]